MRDRFSTQSKLYASFRPTYPKALYEFIINLVKDKSTAWDCGCGNGQVANDLSRYFQKICATDISAKQIENAVSVENIDYSICSAEQTPFDNSVFDLIAVAQALHWFDVSRFYEEAKRVAKPEAILAIWGYGLLRITPSIDKKIDHFYHEVVGPYWDKERKLIDDHYQTILFSFERIPAPDFSIQYQWKLEHVIGYLNTWSSVVRFKEKNGYNPVDSFTDEILPLWGDTYQPVAFPVFTLIARLEK
jgi:ubiquinone/menaquinone biosynthesis C-methylase UbiE